MIGQCLRKRYKIVAKIGQGGMGAVYFAEDQRLAGRRVAVKLLLSGEALSPAALGHLSGEVLALLDHHVSDFFTADEQPIKPVVLVMDYIAGQN